MKSISFLLKISLLIIPLFFSACHKEEEPMRTAENILGNWTRGDNKYIVFGKGNKAYTLTITYQDGESIGNWGEEDDVYFYEPGYDLVIYVSSDLLQADVYKIVEMDENHFTWCWVEEIAAKGTSDISKVIGDIINKAQEGFNLNPELYQTFTRIPQNQFLDLLNSIDIDYSWLDW